MATKRTRRKRTPKGIPWYRNHDGCWYVTLDGDRRKLIKVDGQPVKGPGSKDEAEKAAAREKLGLVDRKAKPTSTPLVADVLDFFLNDIKRSSEERHYKNTKRLFDDLNAYCGAMRADQIRKRHIENWIDKHDGWKSDNTIRNHSIMVLAAFNRAADDEDFGLATNPIKSLKIPPAHGRITAFEDGDIEELVNHWTAKPRPHCIPLNTVADFFVALLHTGARPCELASVTADDVEQIDQGLRLRLTPQDDDGGYRHKSARKTGKVRFIYLNDDAEIIVRRMMLKHPDGHLFRTPKGHRWQHANMVTTFCEAKKWLGWKSDARKSELSFYTARHTFAKRILCGYYGTRGDIYTVAGLLGNTVKVCEEHYAQWCDSYNDPLWAALGKGRKSVSA